MLHGETFWDGNFDNEYITLDTIKNRQKESNKALQKHILKLVINNLPNVLKVWEDFDYYSIFATKSIFNKKEFVYMSKLAVKELKKRKFKVRLIFNSDYHEIRIYGW